MKAELLGNNELADKLKAQLAEARKARQQHLEEQVHVIYFWALKSKTFG